MNVFNYNNLKAKAKLILENYVLDMTIDENLFFMYLSDVNYITDKDKETFLYSDFRYRAFQSGLI